MASRTKSFFERDHGANSKPAHWNRTNNNRQLLSEASVNIPPAKPPIPANSQAKSKLNAFQFVQVQRDETERSDSELGGGENLENADPQLTTEIPSDTSKAAVSSTPRRVEEPVSTAVSLKPTPHLPHANTFPCTPGARLPLEDLIGNFDETAQRTEPQQQSPEEQIGWVPNSSSTLLTPNRRKRKRARSSSPSCPCTSSQQRETASNSGLEEKTTPEADPAADLWSRYAASKDSNGGLKLPDFSHLIFQASPRPLETPMKSGALRRWASTGNDWPSGTHKKRRINLRTNVNVWLDGEQESLSGAKSKVAAMVERVQESLASQKLEQPRVKPTVRIEGPSSSSPLPETGDDFLQVNPPASPLQAKLQQSMLPESNGAALRALQTSKKPQTLLELPSQQPEPSDSTMHHTRLTLDANSPAPLQLQNKAPLPAFRRPTINRVLSGSGRQYPVAQTVPKAAPFVVSEDVDEFGDAFDLTAEDLHDLMMQAPITQSLLNQPANVNPPSQQLTVVQSDHLARVDVSAPTAAAVSAEDEFGGNDDEVGRDEIVEGNDDEFGCDEIDEDSFAQAETSATQKLMMSQRKRSPQKRKSSPLDLASKAPSKVSRTVDSPNLLPRYRVTQVVEGEYINAAGRRCPEKLLVVDNERMSKTIAITLRDSWATTSISPGNMIHVSHLPHQLRELKPSPTPAGQIQVSDEENSPLLVVHPDHMLSATTVADSFDCIRKAVLQDLIKATGETSKPMVYGKILHEVFQHALSFNQWDSTFLAGLVQDTVQNHLEGLWELGMQDTVLAVEEVTAKMRVLAGWAKIYLTPRPSDVSLVEDKQGEKVWMSISKLIAIEEHIWSPRYGLKGNIDATIQSTLIDHPNASPKKLIAPFEVKTGRATQSPAHRAQTALYTLLLSDRYDVSVEAGILYYLENSAMSRIAPPINEIRQMVQQRNRVATYIHRARHIPKENRNMEGQVMQSQDIEQSGLPLMLKSPFKCGRCYARQSCFTYHALVENGSAESAGMIDDNKKDHSLVWQKAVDHLAFSAKNKMQAERLSRWFVKWETLLTREESEQCRYRKELWTMSSAEREATGRCFGSLIIDQDLSSTPKAVGSPIVDGITGSGGKINRYTYVFKRADSCSRTSFTEGTQLTVGEPAVVSSEQGQWALANGYVVASTKHNITVAVDRKLGDARERLDAFEETRNHAFRGIMTVGGDIETKPADDRGILYRLDKDEFSNGLALVRNSLVTLMSLDPIHTKLRDLIINESNPAFAATPSDLPQMPSSQLGQMNEDQVSAVRKVLSAQDYALILGMPGTGKTTTIAHIIRALLADDQSVLLASFTHTAVDNILLKIRDIAPPKSILRLGVPAKINQEVQKFCLLAGTPRQTIDELQEVYMGSKIVATTCMGTNHAVFRRRSFDVCIVDEASQITLPTVLGPLLHARKFVLVGDHYQLPPLVQNRAALEGGLDVSLFRQLSEEHPEAVATLGRQYRMCEDIMNLSNLLIYSGQLRCGSDAVARRTLQLDNPSGLEAFHSQTGKLSACSKISRCWLTELTHPQRKVVFANTDPLGKLAAETLSSGKNITNQLEAALCAQIVLGLLALGVPGKDIGVITLYRSQLALMRQLFKTAGIPNDVEIDSADRFQGRDKECVILSMVRSNELGIVGDLLKDWRRVNVALTRARSKLVVLGSRHTLRNNELLAKFLDLVDERGWTFELPKGADTCHTFDFSSQSTADLMLPQGTPSPLKNVLATTGKPSPRKAQRDGLTNVLQPSVNAGNLSPMKGATQGRNRREPAKTVNGKVMASILKSQRAKQQFEIEIFEDLDADEF